MESHGVTGDVVAYPVFTLMWRAVAWFEDVKDWLFCAKTGGDGS